MRHHEPTPPLQFTRPLVNAPTHLDRELGSGCIWKPGERVWWTRRLNDVLRPEAHPERDLRDIEVDESEYVCKRICADHKKELTFGPNTERPGNKLYCPEGHRCKRWLIVNNRGEILGAEPPAVFKKYKEKE